MKIFIKVLIPTLVLGACIFGDIKLAQWLFVHLPELGVWLFWAKFGIGFLIFWLTFGIIVVATVLSGMLADIIID